MRRVYCRLYEDWPPAIRAKLRRSTFRHGLMLPTLHCNPITYVMLDAQELIGWALVGSIHDIDNWAMFYVKSCYRRQGVGTRLAKRIKRQHNKLHVQTDNRVGANFFRSVGLEENWW